MRKTQRLTAIGKRLMAGLCYSRDNIFVFANPDGSYMGGTGGFSANARQFTLQQTEADTNITFTFNYTVIDKNSISVTPIKDNEWAKGVWKKRANIPGTKLKHQIIGYWEGKGAIKHEYCILPETILYLPLI